MQARKFTLLMLLIVILGMFALPTGAEKVEITLWHHWMGNNRPQLVQKMLDQFNAEHPDIVATQRYQTTSGAKEKLTNFIMSGSSPDVVMVKSGYAMPFISQDGFLPLDEYAKQDELDLGIFNAVDLRGFQLHGTTYALPITSGVAWTNLMFYNQTILDEAGISGPPKTWSEWREFSRKLTKRDSSGSLVRAGTTIPHIAHAVHWNDGSIFSDDWRNATIDTPAMYETVDFLKEVSSDVYGGWSNFYPFFQSHSFYNGDWVFWFQNNSAFGFLKDRDFKWGAVLAPINSEKPNAKPIGIVDSTWAYAIPVTVPEAKRAAAWELLKWLTTEMDSAGWFTRVQGRPSAITAFNRHPDYLQNNPSWSTVIDAVQYDIAVPAVDPYYTLLPYSEQVLAGKQHPKQVLTEAQVIMQLQLDDYWAAIED